MCRRSSPYHAHLQGWCHSDINDTLPLPITFTVVFHGIVGLSATRRFSFSSSYVFMGRRTRQHRHLRHFCSHRRLRRPFHHYYPGTCLKIFDELWLISHRIASSSLDLSGRRFMIMASKHLSLMYISTGLVFDPTREEETDDCVPHHRLLLHFRLGPHVLLPGLPLVKFKTPCHVWHLSSPSVLLGHSYNGLILHASLWNRSFCSLLVWFWEGFVGWISIKVSPNTVRTWMVNILPCSNSDLGNV